MKTVFEHIEYVKGKPRHVREKIAFAAATGCTAFIAFVWLVVSLSTGTFALKNSSFVGSVGRVPTSAPAYDGEKSGLAGAAAALSADENAPAHIEIVDVATSTTEKRAEQTILPF